MYYNDVYAGTSTTIGARADRRAEAAASTESSGARGKSRQFQLSDLLAKTAFFSILVSLDNLYCFQ